MPKIGWIGFHKSCDISGTIKNITITSRGGQWFASIQVEQTIEIGKHASDSEIGIDAGIKCFAAFSDGTLVEGVNSFRKHEEAAGQGAEETIKKEERIKQLEETKEKNIKASSYDCQCTFRLSSQAEYRNKQKPSKGICGGIADQGV